MIQKSATHARPSPELQFAFVGNFVNKLRPGDRIARYCDSFQIREHLTRHEVVARLQELSKFRHIGHSRAYRAIALVPRANHAPDLVQGCCAF